MTSKKIIHICFIIAAIFLFLYLAPFALFFIAPPHPSIVILCCEIACIIIITYHPYKVDENSCVNNHFTNKNQPSSNIYQIDPIADQLNIFQYEKVIQLNRYYRKASLLE